MNKPFSLINDRTLQFLFLFSNANHFYISARNNLQNGRVVPGCSNAHQAIELYIKAILKLNHEEEHGHDLIELLKKYESRESFFSSILRSATQSELLKELSNAYLSFRYGETGAISNSLEIIKIVDELAYNLHKIYLKKLSFQSSELYISDDEKNDFLKDNNFFKETDLTNNPLAQFGLPLKP